MISKNKGVIIGIQRKTKRGVYQMLTLEKIFCSLTKLDGMGNQTLMSVIEEVVKGEMMVSKVERKVIEKGIALGQQLRNKQLKQV